MWCKITGQLSHNNPRLRLYLSPNYFHRRETKPAEKKIISRVSLFYLYHFTWKKKELVLWSPVIVTLKS